MKSVLKYPGSKWRVAKQLVSRIPPHRSYVEPFFGSGAVLFNKEPSGIETINDMNDDVVNLFQCIQRNPQRLSHLLATTPFARTVYESAYKQEYEDAYEKALKFMIKCHQGHGFRMNGEKVGWKNDVQGREKAYALKRWCDLPADVLEIADRLKQVQIDHRPAIELIQRFNYENVFMYLDPPYVISTRSDQRGQYSHEMDDADHIELLNEICKSKAKIMISGYESDIYSAMLSGWYKEVFKSNDNRGKATREIVWMNYAPPTQISIFDLKGE